MFPKIPPTAEITYRSWPVEQVMLIDYLHNNTTFTNVKTRHLLHLLVLGLLHDWPFSRLVSGRSEYSLYALRFSSSW
jgi:hypothetical protein